MSLKKIDSFQTPIMSHSSTSQSLEPMNNSPPEVKVYTRRWVMLAIFVMYSTTNAFHWIQYSIITEVVIRYYGVSTLAVDWTSITYMLTYIPLIFPAAWVLEKKNLKFCMLIGVTGTALGSWIKCGSISPDRFWVAFLGQTIVAISQVFILGLPPKVAAVWFGSNEVSTACSIGVFGNQLGIAIGFLLPPQIVPNSSVIEEVSRGFTILYFSQAVFVTILLLLIVFVFQGSPPSPPSRAQAALMDMDISGGYHKSILRFLTNRNFLLLLITYGLNVGVFYAVSTLLSQLILEYYDNSYEDSGLIGLTMVLTGVIGSGIAGTILDKTHMYKQTTLAVYAMTLIGMIVCGGVLPLGHIQAVYFAFGLLGFFMTGYLPMGFEFGAELTYPEAEGTGSGLLNCFAQVCGIIMTNVGSVVLSKMGPLFTNGMFCATLLVGLILTCFIKNDLRRQTAQHKGTHLP